MTTLGVPVKTAAGDVVGRAVVGSTDRITAFLDENYVAAIRETLLMGFAHDLVIDVLPIPAVPERNPMDPANAAPPVDTNDIMGRAKKLVHAYVVTKLDKSDPVPVFEVYVVWFSKTLKNWKALISTTLPDKMYYEVTYDGDREQTYLDAYIKLDNVCYPDHVGKKRTGDYDFD